MKSPKRSILMDPFAMKKVVDLARLGLSTKEISRRTGFSEHQVHYRLHTHKEVAQLDQGLRQAWREGNNPIVDQILQDNQRIMQLDWERRFLHRVLIVSPKPIKVQVGSDECD